MISLDAVENYDITESNPHQRPRVTSMLNYTVFSNDWLDMLFQA